MAAAGRPTGQGWGRVAVAGLLVTLLGGGAWAWSAGRARLTSAPTSPAAVAVAPILAGGDTGTAGAMSPRALAQYRAFYAQQLASEAALERWAPPRAGGARDSAAQRAFYTEQLASEAELEPWSPAVRGLPATDIVQLPRYGVDGVQFE